MAKSFKNVVQDSLRTGQGIPVKTKNPLSPTNTPTTEPPFGLKPVDPRRCLCFKLPTRSLQFLENEEFFAPDHAGTSVLSLEKALRVKTSSSRCT